MQPPIATGSRPPPLHADTRESETSSDRLSLPDWARRPQTGIVVTAVAIAFLTFATAPELEIVSILDAALMYLMLTLVVSVVWGYLPGIFAAIASDLLVNFFFVPPLYTFRVAERSNVAALVLFLGAALLGAVMVGRLRAEATLARQRETENRTLLSVSRALLRASDPHAALERFCEAVVDALHVRGCAVVRAGDEWSTIAASGSMQYMRLTGTDVAAADDALQTQQITRRAAIFVPLPEGQRGRGVLWLMGTIAPDLVTDPNRLLRALATEAELGLRELSLAEEAQQAESLRHADRSRELRLATAAENLRSTLSEITAAVTGLRTQPVPWRVEDVANFAGTIEAQAHQLTAVASDLSRIDRIEGGSPVR